MLLVWIITNSFLSSLKYLSSAKTNNNLTMKNFSMGLKLYFHNTFLTMKKLNMRQLKPQDNTSHIRGMIYSVQAQCKQRTILSLVKTKRLELFLQLTTPKTSESNGQNNHSNTECNKNKIRKHSNKILKITTQIWNLAVISLCDTV